MLKVHAGGFQTYRRMFPDMQYLPSMTMDNTKADVHTSTGVPLQTDLI